MQKLNVNSNKNGIIANVGVSAEIKNSVPRKIFLMIMQKVKIDFQMMLYNIKSVFDKDQNNCYYNLFLDNCSYQLVTNK